MRFVRRPSYHVRRRRADLVGLLLLALFWTLLPTAQAGAHEMLHAPGAGRARLVQAPTPQHLTVAQAIFRPTAASPIVRAPGCNETGDLGPCCCVGLCSTVAELAWSAPISAPTRSGRHPWPGASVPSDLHAQEMLRPPEA